MKFFFLVFFICILQNIWGQRPVISLENQNVLYIGIDNYIRIACENYKSGQLEVSISGKNNSIKFISEDRYVINVSNDTDVCFIYVNLRNKHKKILGMYRYTISKIPIGYASFGKLELGNNTLSDILEQKQILYNSDVIISGVSEYAKIITYTAVIMPKRGSMEMITYYGDSINSDLMKRIAVLDDGDMIVFHQIRLQIANNNVPITPFYLLINKYNSGNSLYNTYRIKGNYIKDNEIKTYIFPSSEHQYPITDNLIKHGSWIRWQYDDSIQEYIMLSIDSFKYGKLKKSEFYKESFLDYMVEYINDSITRYTSYFKNGNVYQIGKVNTESYSQRYSISDFYEDPSIILKRSGYLLHLYNIKNPFSPIGHWKTYDSLGNLDMSVTYVNIKDSIRESMNMDNFFNIEHQFESVSYFLVVPDGDIIFYKSDGTIQEQIRYKHGKLISR